MLSTQNEKVFIAELDYKNGGGAKKSQASKYHTCKNAENTDKVAR